MIRIGLGVTLLLLAAHAHAQGPAGPQSPNQLLNRFRVEAQAAAKGGEEAVGRVVALFDLSDITLANQRVVGVRAAGVLFSSLERHGWPARLPTGGDRAEYSVEIWPGHELLCRKQEDGRWKFGAEMLERLDKWEKELGEVAFGTGSTWLRDLMPDWLRNEVFLLANWQWLGLLALILAGIIVSQIAKVALFGVAQRAAQARGVTLGRFKGARRPFGLVAIASLWLIGLPLLQLPPRTFDILNLAVRLVLMVGSVWSLCRVVDFGAEIFGGLAQRTASKLDDLLVPMLRKSLKLFIIALGLIWIADNMGMDIAALVAGLGIGGVAIALASKDTVENFFGALSILTDRPFQVGDWIVMGDIEGTVAEVGFRSTRVRTFYNSVITFPNAMLIRTAVDNLGARQFRRVKLTLGVTYDTPPHKLESFIEGIRELIRTHPYTRKDYYHVYFHKFGDSSLDILLYLFLSTPDWATELRERHRMLIDILRLAEELEVEFAFPTRTLHMLQGEPPAPPGTDPGTDPGTGAGTGAGTDPEADPEADPETASEVALVDAWRRGRHSAQEIVQKFTGSSRPPPVTIGRRPDEALADDGE